MLKELPALSPVSLFSLSVKPKKGLLSDLTYLTGEASFADVSVQVDGQSLILTFSVRAPAKESVFPAVERGDGIECFIDTRNLKDAKTIHKFCHHFVFLPVAVDGVQGIEVTTFRGDDSHDLCQQVPIEVSITARKYELTATLTSNELYGFDPEDHPKIGFAYRIHRLGKDSQHFGVPSKEFALAKHPFLWPELILK